MSEHVFGNAKQIFTHGRLSAFLKVITNTAEHSGCEPH
jgi:hypothetical protein